MFRLLALLLLLASPVLGGGADLSGTWTGTIVTVGTRMESTYSPITGVTVTPVPDVQVMPSPFGPLILSADGSYEMPVPGLSGTWTEEGGALHFTGGLAGVEARVEWLDPGPAITLAMPLGDGTTQGITFTR